MNIKQFKDAPLAHYSYAVVSEGKMAVIDPSRNPMQYYEYAEDQKAKIVAVFETHPHADFVSGHLQIREQTGATIYVSKLLGADYEHTSFDDGDEFKMGEIGFSALNTPGHSPDSITIVAKEDKETILFTGDTLFIGNVGRPDLRENSGNMKSKRVELAKAMYNTIKTKFNNLPDDALVYPAHGAGSLCGKNMSDASSSTLGNERQGNWAFKEQTEDEFVEEILKDQPFIPHYFGYDVDLNKKGARNVQASTCNPKIIIGATEVKKDSLIVDTRNEEVFKNSHFPNSYNIMANSPTQKFETWLGAIIKPKEKFSVVLENISQYEEVIGRIAKIGYETQLESVMTVHEGIGVSSDEFDLEDFKKNEDHYTIVDIRNKSEVQDRKIFEDSIVTPLNELRENHNDIPSNKPIVVHCAGGYRSAAGSSILENIFPETRIYDLGDSIKEF